MGLIDNWLSETIQGDLAAFADPGTTVTLNSTSLWLQARWSRRGRDITNNFRTLPRNPGAILARTDTGEEPYANFLAGDRMADLKAIARNTSRAVEPVPGFVEPRIQVDDAPARAAAEFELDALVRRTDSGTNLIFVTADAGVGKTSLLTEIVRRKATDYALARTQALWLYVNAQGSRLARLDQALAAALDDVGALFPYHAVAPLVRSGALVLVIDGFDELIGAPGTYDDAYSSLASFLSSLDGHGTIVATARSAYYEQEFLTRVGKAPGLAGEAWALSRVELAEWNDQEQLAFLAAFARLRDMTDADRGPFSSHVLELFDSSNASGLAAKPFFLARVAEFSADGLTLQGGNSLLDRLVNTYLSREVSTKLLTSLGAPILTAAQLSQVYEEIANEMWRQETRELSGASFKELVDFLAQVLELQDAGRLAILDRLPNSAFVHPGMTPGSVTFEHEIFFSYFLARPIIASLATGEPFAIATALRKGRLPNQAGEIVGRALIRDAAKLLRSLGDAPRSISLGIDQIRQNAGVIAASMIRAGLPPSTTIDTVDFVDVDLSRALIRELIFRHCSFRSADLRGAEFVECRTDDVRFMSVIIDAGTKLDVAGPETEDFLGLRYEAQDGRTSSVYAPTELQRVLASAGLPAAMGEVRTAPIPLAIQELVTKVARMFERSNIASFDNDLEQRRLVREPHWYDLYTAFIESGVLAEEFRHASGRRQTFVRMSVRPADLMGGLGSAPGTDPRVVDFWRRLAELE